MKLILTAAALACAPAAAFAQTAPAPATTPAPAAAPAAAAKFSADTPIEALFANEAAKAVLVADGLGDVEKHPAYDQFKAMSFRAVQPFSEGKITDELLAKLDTDLAKIK
ncbi:3-oxoacyl-ACP reductase-like protein [Sphingomonas kyeonggiensis]|uniref:3-oxoacyl-ACP reductase-like protein n=1 Tax=Sphingomonas kyeonggiensis TaxID=1268553 RepID=A0A7W7JYA8_9SPHN|nr:hypothetical protein [Sphingomonas kyeonggiensis]MBB4837578.1 3-oxoacyl-ACP reductase-like protein [Sphingomonas kyeonggiensis]